MEGVDDTVLRVETFRRDVEEQALTVSPPQMGVLNRGGHPTPAGRDLLKRRSSERPVDVRLSWSDLTQHLADPWQGFCSALPLYDPRCGKDGPLYGPHRSPDGREEIDTLLTTWRERDPLARHYGLPWTE